MDVKNSVSPSLYYYSATYLPLPQNATTTHIIILRRVKMRTQTIHCAAFNLRRSKYIFQRYHSKFKFDSWVLYTFLCFAYISQDLSSQSQLLEVRLKQKSFCYYNSVMATLSLEKRICHERKRIIKTSCCMIKNGGEGEYLPRKKFSFLPTS